MCEILQIENAGLKGPGHFMAVRLRPVTVIARQN